MTKEEVKIIKREKFEVSNIESNILLFRYYRDQVIDIKEVQEGYEILDEWMKDEKARRIVLFEKYAIVTKSARELIQKNKRPSQAEAVVVVGMAQKLLVNIFMKLRASKHPIRAFDKYEDALKWIRTK